MRGSHAGGIRFRRVHVAGPELPPPSAGCRACSREDYGPCTCPADCGWLSCTGAWRESHPVTREAVAAKLAERAGLTAQGGIEAADAGHGVPGCKCDACASAAPSAAVLPYTAPDGEWLRWHAGVRDGRYEDVAGYADGAELRAHAGCDAATRNLHRAIEAGLHRVHAVIGASA